MADFAGILGANFRRKTKKKAKKKDSRKKEDILEGCQIQGKKENTKVHPTQFSSTCFELQEKHIKLYRNARPVNLLFQLQFRAEHSNTINFFSLPGLLCCFAVYKARLIVIEGSNPFVKSNLQSCPARTIKHVPALLQTVVSFPTPYMYMSPKSLLISCAQFFATLI